MIDTRETNSWPSFCEATAWTIIPSCRYSSNIHSCANNFLKVQKSFLMLLGKNHVLNSEWRVLKWIWTSNVWQSCQCCLNAHIITVFVNRLLLLWLKLSCKEFLFDKSGKKRWIPDRSERRGEEMVLRGRRGRAEGDKAPGVCERQIVASSPRSHPSISVWRNANSLLSSLSLPLHHHPAHFSSQRTRLDSASDAGSSGGERGLRW